MLNNRGGKSPTSFLSSILSIAAIIALLLLPMTADALAESITFAPTEKAVDQGSTATFDIVMDSAPKGLAGYEMNVSLASPGIAEITSVAYPEWASLNRNGSFPAETVMISGVDLGHKVQNGSTKVTLATITVQGDSPGQTDIKVNVKELDADGGSPIQPEASPARLTVQKPLLSTGSMATTATDIGSTIQPYVIYLLVLMALVVIAVFAYIIVKKK